MKINANINKVQVELCKQAIKKGKNIKDSIIAAGMSPKTADGKAGNCKTYQVAEQQVLKELRAKQLDADWFINRVEQKVINKTDNPDIIRKAISDQARFAGIDNQPTNVTNVYQLSETVDPEILTRRARAK
jgi:hypothetical protein